MISDWRDMLTKAAQDFKEKDFNNKPILNYLESMEAWPSLEPHLSSENRSLFDGRTLMVSGGIEISPYITNLRKRVAEIENEWGMLEEKSWIDMLCQAFRKKPKKDS